MRIVGVEPEKARTLCRASAAAGRPVDTEAGGIAADSLGVGPVPVPNQTFTLPDFGSGTLRAVRVGVSPLPGDPRSCVFAEVVHEPLEL